MSRPEPPKIFGSDYDDPRTRMPQVQAGTDRERIEVVKQAKHLANLRNDPDYLARTVKALHDRRTERPDLVEFEAVHNDGIDAYVVPGELLVRREDLDLADVVALIADLGLGVAELEGRADGTSALVRLVEAERDPRKARLRGRMAELLGTLRSAKTTAVSPRYICPLGAVIKGEGGPEPSGGGREFPTYTPAPPGSVTVAVIDTGITAEVRGDQWLQGLLGTDNEDELDVIPARDGALDLGAGHGTFVAGVVQQVAPYADLLVLRAMDTDGVGTDSAVGDMVMRAAEEGAMIINLSLGTQTLDDEGPLALRVALEDLFARHPDVLVVAAAGNYGDTRPCFPAAFAEEFPGKVVAVAGLTPSGVGAPWSSHGGWVSCAAVGEGVVSTYVIGTEDIRVDNPPDTFRPNSWATWTGTSFAAPQVAGAVARRCQETVGLLPQDAAAQLFTEGVELAGFGSSMVILPGT